MLGDSRLYLENIWRIPPHRDANRTDTHGRVVSLGERECSVQRRHQVIEEAPSLIMTPDYVRKWGRCRPPARAGGYVNAGTVGFWSTPISILFSGVNARLQVEHPSRTVTD
jgi:acetyl/propionyl-CoA carboxylase alpha subunit